MRLFLTTVPRALYTSYSGFPFRDYYRVPRNAFPTVNWRFMDTFAHHGNAHDANVYSVEASGLYSKVDFFHCIDLVTNEEISRRRNRLTITQQSWSIKSTSIVVA